jgi:hypothetical protein
MQLPSLFAFAFQATSVAAAVIANGGTTLLDALNGTTWQGMYDEGSLATVLLLLLVQLRLFLLLRGQQKTQLTWTKRGLKILQLYWINRTYRLSFS